MTPQPFQWNAPEAALEELRARLRATRWPEAMDPDGGWRYGFPLRELREICRYWAEEFDWRRAEAAMFVWPHFMAQLGSYRVHFLHVRSRHAGALPLLVTHGWPGSFLEFLPLIPLLEDFDLVIPSLPGFGFSPHPGLPVCNTFAIAEVWAQLMTALGYERFGVQGGDIGASVSTILGWQHAPRVRGVHLNYIPDSYRPAADAAAPLTAEEQEFLADKARWAAAWGAYEHVQCQQPQTLSYGLTDSPAGLAAWILECFRNWGDCSGRLTPCFGLNDLLANVTLYWLTGSIGSSCRLYWESSRAPLALAMGERVPGPCAIAHFPKEAPFPPRSWVERGYHVVRWTEMPRGGHFAALEAPELLAADIRSFFCAQ